MVSAAFGTDMQQRGNICTFGRLPETQYPLLTVNPFPAADLPQKTLPEFRAFEATVVVAPQQLTDKPQWGSGAFLATNPSAVRSVAVAAIPGHVLLISEPGQVDPATLGRVADSLVQALR